MNPIRFVLNCAFVAMAGMPLLGLAEDIDIYDKNNSSSNNPNVLIILDNGASFSASSSSSCIYKDDKTAPSLGNTAGGIEQCALYNVIHDLAVRDDGSARINLGMMLYNDSSFNSLFGCPGGTGGCLVKPLTPMTATAKADFKAWIRTWQTSNSGNGVNIKGNTQYTASSMQEAWAYFAGKEGMSGRDYSTIKPTNSGCQNNFVIFIGNAVNSAGSPGDGSGTDPESKLKNAPGITSTLSAAINIPSQKYGAAGFVCDKGTYKMGNHTNSSGLFADEWARYMQQVDLNGIPGGQLNITTYTVGMLSDQCKPEYPAVLTSMATFGGGEYFATTNYDEINKALTKIFNQVLAVNSVFSSASLPVSVNTQGAYLNQIYMGMFRPEAKGLPRWMGNLKQYQFKMNTTSNMLELADSKGDPAISKGGTGFIDPGAISFWTTKNTNTAPDSAGGFWKNMPQGDALGFDSPDGDVVEKGGAAQQLRLANLTSNYTTTAGSSTNPRRLYTYCPGGGSTCDAQLSNAANAFATSNAAITAGLLGVADTARVPLINWVRGEDNVDDTDIAGSEKGPGGTITVRPSIHGDVLHSRPVVLNYAGSVVVFYGGNDGVFRAINGNKTEAIGSVPTGGELWGLILPEFYGKLNRLRANSPVIKMPTTDPLLNPAPKDYFVDGPTGVFQQLKADKSTDKAYLYLTMRRGGRFMYGLDVSSPTNPRVLWRKSNASAGMGELGQTWSRPALAVIKGYPNPVIIFGAGYSPTQDIEPPTADTMGRGIFVLDAVTGDLVWSAGPGAGSATTCSGTTVQASCAVAGMNYSIPGDIAILDRDRDGYVDRLYAADLGGNVWRVDLEPTAGNTPDKWKVRQLAALGCADGPCASGTPRKLFFQPSVISLGPDNVAQSYDAVMVGSGDREHPLYSTSPNSAYNVENRLYMLKDKAPGKDGGNLRLITEQTLFDATNTAYDNTRDGFYVKLKTGEKSVNAPLTLSGFTSFGTNQAEPPTANSCNSSLGIARIYSMNVFTGDRTSTILDGGGLPPSPVSGIVEVDNKKVGFCIGCITPPSPPDSPNPPATKCNSALENCYQDKDGKKKMGRTYWYKK